MGGGSSASTQEQSTTQASVDGVVTGTVLAGSGNVRQEAQTILGSGDRNRIEIGTLEQIPESVENVVLQLLDLSNRSLDVAFAAGSAAIDKVGERAEAATQPELALTSRLMPLALLAVAGVIIWKVFK